MTDLHARFRTLDDLSAPNLWYDIEERAMATQPTTRRSGAWVLIAVTLLLALAIGGAVLVGSGIVKLPVTVDASASPASVNPSSSARESTAASASPVPQVPASWTATGNMIDARVNHTATLLPNGKVLVAGGNSGSVLLATAELYDPSSGSWTATGKMNGIRTAHTATLLADGKVLVAGGADSIGETSVNAVATAELYDPATGSWTTTAPMIEARAHHTATLLADGKVLVAGGSGSGSGSDSLDTAELYDPATGTWTVAGTMIEARTRHTATLLPDGRVLVLGGSSASPPEATAELYDPSTGAWTAAGNMNGEHLGGTATLLEDGSVLVAGGGSSDGSGGEELYDPSTGSWSATASLLEARTDHTATLLDDGSVLVAGGSSSGGMLASAELYGPGSGN